MNPEVWSEIITKLQASAHPEEVGFKPLDEIGGEKHGSWVWICTRNDPDMIRLAELGVTQLSMPDKYSGYFAEVSAGGDNESRFQRLALANLQYPNLEALVDDASGEIAKKFREAMDRAIALRVEDLIVPRPRIPRFPQSL